MAASVWTHQGYELVVGLEVHVQLRTASKLFSPAKNDTTGAPNTNVDVVDVALPGTLPVLNGAVKEQAIKLGLALEATIDEASVFARKHYVYPDLPKGYQISQADRPVLSQGRLPFFADGDDDAYSVRIVRAHLEEDAGKSIHVDGGDTALDYNRAGVPLIEVVTAPELRTPEQAMACFRSLRSIVMALGICDGNLQEGSMRADANVSVRPIGTAALGTRTEIKNLNSPRYVAAAIEHEARRQISQLLAGIPVVQQTRLWDADKRETRALRSKEDAHDYRYLADPDLPPLCISAADIAAVRMSLPELPHARRQRYQISLGLTPYDARLLSEEPEFAHYFEAARRVHDNAKGLANWILNDLQASLATAAAPTLEEHLPSTALAELVRSVDDGAISGKSAKDLLAHMVSQREFDVFAIIENKGWSVRKDDGALHTIVAEVLLAHPEQVQKARTGNVKMMGFFVGQVMKRGGSAFDPKDINRAIAQQLQ